MAAAGYDVSRGDSWALNEASTAVRRGTGNARANLREFLRGLYEGDGTRPTRGAVLVVGFGQQTADLSLYQSTLQNWLADSAFWTDMSTYVSDWSQEVYGDVRSYAVPGVPTSVRRDYLNDYLQHKLVLANAGPATIETARAFLRATFSPLANAAWERDTGYGWTMVPAEQMASYVSAQVHALRYFSATTGQAQDHWGFAWAPRNAAGIPAAEFTARTGLILDRLAAAIRDSATTVDPADPGSAACGPPGQNLWCTGDVAGASLAEAWKSFRSWTQSSLAFGSQPQTLAAGVPSAAIALSLTTSSGLPVTTPTELAVTLSTSSPQGGFATSPAGPWTPTLGLTIAAGTGTVPAFYYRDTRAGSHVLTASAAGASSGTQTITVTPGPVAALAVKPATATVRAGMPQRFVVSGTDAHGNAAPVPTATWSVVPSALGTVGSTTGAVTTFRAGRTPGGGAVVATVATEAGTLTAQAEVQRGARTAQDRVGPLPAPSGLGARDAPRGRRRGQADLGRPRLHPRQARRPPHRHVARAHRRRRQGDLPGAGAPEGLLRDLGPQSVGLGLSLGRPHAAEPLLPAPSRRRRARASGQRLKKSLILGVREV